MISFINFAVCSVESVSFKMMHWPSSLLQVLKPSEHFRKQARVRVLEAF